MSQADIEYGKVIRSIYNHGVWDTGQEVRGKYADGTPAHTISWFGYQMRFDNSEVPILTTKQVYWKTAIKELLWIWQKKSNVVQDLRDMGVKIWNEWEREDGTIGKAYGFQLGKKNRIITGDIRGGKDGQVLFHDWSISADQVDYLLHQLKNNPASRRHITTLWNPDDLDDMSLTPCVYETQWHVKGGKLHLEVRCRSNDMSLGNPFNVFQYNVLQRMIAQVTGLELGEYIYHIGDAHIYDRHLDRVLRQIRRRTYSAPKLIINPEVKNFYDFTIDDFQLVDYEHGDKINFDISI
ncbi:thymidylate synthase [Bacillus mojavensis]